jgi:hypothetical protein
VDFSGYQELQNGGMITFIVAGAKTALLALYIFLGGNYHTRPRKMGDNTELVLGYM